MHTKTEIRAIRQQAADAHDLHLVALCELALAGRVSDETRDQLTTAQASELAEWDSVSARDHVESLPAPPIPSVPEDP
jgi:hypothetical protein